MIKNILVSFLISAAVFFAGIFIYNKYMENNRGEEVYYVVDVERIYKPKRDMLKQLIESGADPKAITEFRGEMIKYVKSVEKYLSALSEKNDIVIFNKRAIFSKNRTIDLTKEVMSAIE